MLAPAPERLNQVGLIHRSIVDALARIQAHLFGYSQRPRGASCGAAPEW